MRCLAGNCTGWIVNPKQIYCPEHIRQFSGGKPEGQWRLEKRDFMLIDTPSVTGTGFIAIGDVPEYLRNTPEFDETVFYYCETEQEFDRLFGVEGNGEFRLFSESEEYVG